MHKLHRERKRIIEEEGAYLVEMSRRRKHILYRLRTPRGPRTISASNTPQDATIALKNFRADVRKVLTMRRH